MAAVDRRRAPQNTSVRPKTVVVHYPFHAYHTEELSVVVVPRHPDDLYTVSLPTSQLKIPGWMLRPAAAAFAVSPLAVVDRAALLSLVELLECHSSDSDAPSCLSSNTLAPQSEESGKEAFDGTASASRFRPCECTKGGSAARDSRRGGLSDGGSDRGHLQSAEREEP
jgi:hypothetical protein